MAKSPGAPKAFATPEALGDWLAAHHDTATELWVKIYKAGSGKASVKWADCVLESLRFGWIDGHKKPLDDEAFLQRLSPRKARSAWSAKNRDHAEKLITEGRMTPAGQVHIDAAKADGRWAAGYAGQADMVIPQDFLDALEKMPAAKAFFATLDRKNLYPIYYRLQTAKRPETRAKRMAQILAQLERGERFH